MRAQTQTLDILLLTRNREDVLRSIGTLKSLGNGFEVVQIGSTQFLHTIPRESNQDLLLAIQQVQASKRVSEDQIIGSLEWSPERAHRILVGFFVGISRLSEYKTSKGSTLRGWSSVDRFPIEPRRILDFQLSNLGYIKLFSSS